MKQPRRQARSANDFICGLCNEAEHLPRHPCISLSPDFDDRLGHRDVNSMFDMLFSEEISDVMVYCQLTVGHACSCEAAFSPLAPNLQASTKTDATLSVPVKVEFIPSRTLSVALAVNVLTIAM